MGTIRMHLNILRAASLALVALIFIVPAFSQAAYPALGGDRPIASMSDNADIRRGLWDTMMAAPRAAVLASSPAVEKNAWGAWSVSAQRGKDAFYVVVSPERMTPDQGLAFPIYAQGSWIIKRSDRDGSFLQAKIFLRSDTGTFARIYPYGARSRIDIVAYGGVLYREVIVPLPFEEVLKSPFTRIRELTADVIDWSLFSPEPALYGDLRIMESAIRVRLPELRYADDGAIDQDDRPVLISTLADQVSPAGLNCSGFAKWLVDGIRYPLTGTYLSVAALTDRMLDWRGSSFTIKFEETLDPFFGLDWARALAREAWATFHPSRRDESPLANDVDDPPFALRVKDADPVNGGSAYEAFADNFDDVGLDMRGLKAELFVLASREPGRFYLAQFNARDKAAPNIRRYFHIAALFPYFDEAGIFRVTVFESAAETSLDRILADRDYEFVKLVRFPVSSRFEPQSLLP